MRIIFFIFLFLDVALVAQDSEFMNMDLYEGDGYMLVFREYYIGESDVEGHFEYNYFFSKRLDVDILKEYLNHYSYKEFIDSSLINLVSKDNSYYKNSNLIKSYNGVLFDEEKFWLDETYKVDCIWIYEANICIENSCSEKLRNIVNGAINRSISTSDFYFDNIKFLWVMCNGEAIPSGRVSK
jgi:hypothetical protein